MMLNAVRGFGGGEAADVTLDQVYGHIFNDKAPPTEIEVEGQLRGWVEMGESKQQELIDLGLCNEEGIYKKPHIM